MKKAFVVAVACMLVLLVCDISLAADAVRLNDDAISDNWMIEEYVDEFRLPTGQQYITNAHPIGGTYTHGRGIYEELQAYWFIEEDTVSLMLYSDGAYAMPGDPDHDTEYILRIRYPSDIREDVSATLNPSLGRLTLSENSAYIVRDAFAACDSLSFYIQSQSDESENYLFTMTAMSGFTDAWHLLTGAEYRLYGTAYDTVIIVDQDAWDESVRVVDQEGHWVSQVNCSCGTVLDSVEAYDAHYQAKMSSPDGLEHDSYIVSNELVDEIVHYETVHHEAVTHTQQDRVEDRATENDILTSFDQEKRTEHLNEEGICDRPTPEITPQPTSEPTPEPIPAATPILIDETSDQRDIIEVQQLLADRGWLPTRFIDGIWGERTEQAIIAFQKFVNQVYVHEGEEPLNEDGVCDEATLNYLRRDNEHGGMIYNPEPLED